jgi:oxygen-dependent protoporphyrinogen oxidase
MRNVVILGGGISGLTCAWSLARGSPRLNITLLEGSGRTGGWIQSDRLAHGGGVHELGPRSMRTAHTAGKVSLAMLQELGLESQIIPICRGHKAAQRRLIHTDQFDLVEIPSNLSWLYKRKPPFTRPLLPSLAKEPFIGPIKDQNDESVHDFISRRFGNEIAKWLIDPMCRGIYAGSSKELSIKSCFPLLHNYETNHGSILKGIMFGNPSKSGVDNNELVAKAKKDKWMLYTLKDGLQTLTDTLTDAAISIGVDICTDTSTIGIEFEDDEQIKITTDDGSEYMADYLISTIPAKSNIINTKSVTV